MAEILGTGTKSLKQRRSAREQHPGEGASDSWDHLSDHLPPRFLLGSRLREGKWFTDRSSSRKEGKKACQGSEARLLPESRKRRVSRLWKGVPFGASSVGEGKGGVWVPEIWNTKRCVMTPWHPARSSFRPKSPRFRSPALWYRRGELGTGLGGGFLRAPGGNAPSPPAPCNKCPVLWQQRRGISTAGIGNRQPPAVPEPPPLDTGGDPPCPRPRRRVWGGTRGFGHPLRPPPT